MSLCSLWRWKPSFVSRRWNKTNLIMQSLEMSTVYNLIVVTPCHYGHTTALFAELNSIFFTMNKLKTILLICSLLFIETLVWCQKKAWWNSFCIWIFGHQCYGSGKTSIAKTIALSYFIFVFHVLCNLLMHSFVHGWKNISLVSVEKNQCNNRVIKPSPSTA